MDVIVGVLKAWPNDQLCPDLADFGQLLPDLWPTVAEFMAKSDQNYSQMKL